MACITYTLGVDPETELLLLPFFECEGLLSRLVFDAGFSDDSVDADIRPANSLSCLFSSFLFCFSFLLSSWISFE